MLDTDHSAFREDSHIEFCVNFVKNYFNLGGEGNDKNLIDKLKKSKIDENLKFDVIDESFKMKKVISDEEVDEDEKIDIGNEKILDFGIKKVVSDKNIEVLNNDSVDKKDEKIVQKNDKKEELKMNSKN